MKKIITIVLLLTATLGFGQSWYYKQLIQSVNQVQGYSNQQWCDSLVHRDSLATAGGGGSSCVTGCSLTNNHDAIWFGTGSSGLLLSGNISDLAQHQVWFVGNDTCISASNYALYPSTGIYANGLSFGDGYNNIRSQNDIMSYGYTKANYTGSHLLAVFSVGTGNAVNLNTTGDLTVNLGGVGSRWEITNIIITNVTGTILLADDPELWTGTARSGTALFGGITLGATFFTYMTSTNFVADYTVTQLILPSYPTNHSQLTVSVISPIYFSLSTANGAALTCDLYIYGIAF